MECIALLNWVACRIYNFSFFFLHPRQPSHCFYTHRPGRRALLGFRRTFWGRSTHQVAVGSTRTVFGIFLFPKQNISLGGFPWNQSLNEYQNRKYHTQKCLKKDNIKGTS